MVAAMTWPEAIVNVATIMSVTGGFIGFSFAIAWMFRATKGR